MKKNALTWFEIPTADLDRAARFYEAMLGAPLRREVFGGTPMAVLPYDGDPGIGGALVCDDARAPGAGTLVYLDTADLDGALARAAKGGGRVVLPRTPIGPHGFIAIVEDTEGNKVGLNQLPA